MNNSLELFRHRYTHHITPLHYVPHIARTGLLLSKQQLRGVGFKDSHFRSTSRRADERRGFGHVVHTALCPSPPILESKLRLGIPHVCLVIPTVNFDDDQFALCRYNIAKNRGLFGESDANGRVRAPYGIPVALTRAEKMAMLTLYGAACLEVLFFDRIALPNALTVRVFSETDASVVSRVLRVFGRNWSISIDQPPVIYEPRPAYRAVADDYITGALSDPYWTGFPIEFDR